MDQSGSDPQRGVPGYFVAADRGAQGSSQFMVNTGELLGRFKWLIVLGTAIGGALFLALSMVVSPQYRAEVLVAPIEESPGGMLSQLGGALGGLGSLAGINLSEGASRFESIAVLESKSLTLQFIDDRSLMPTLFADAWDADANAWRDGEEPSTEDAFQLFNDDIRSVASDRESGLIRVAITWSDPEQAADWANALVERANETLRQRAIDELSRSIEFLNEQLENTTVVGVRQAIFSVVESQIEKTMLANVRDEYAFKVLDPALTPDRDDEVFPNRIAFLFAGLVLGLALSLLLAVFLHLRRDDSATA